jgi:hypothetical protein
MDIEMVKKYYNRLYKQYIQLQNVIHLYKRISMTNLGGSRLVISRLWHCYSECNSGSQNTAVSCASGTVGTRRITM